MKHIFKTLVAGWTLHFAMSASTANAALLIESLIGPVTQNEINSFKTYMQSQVPPETPWGDLNGTGHNSWCDGPGGLKLQAMALMYEVTGDIEIMNRMVGWTDFGVSLRNDLLPASKGGQRLLWDGLLDKVWIAQNLTNTRPSTVCESGDTAGHILY